MPIFDYAARQANARAIPGVDAIVLVPGKTLYYFTGLDFHLSERPTIVLLLPDGRRGIITPELEMPRIRARDDLHLEAFSWDDTTGYAGAFQRAVEALGLRGKTLGADGLSMRVTEWLAFQQVDSTLRVKAVEGQLTRIRAIKSAEEIALMRDACQRSERALAAILPQVEVGMSERQIADLLNRAVQAEGCTGVAFEALVQTGPNSALPHGEVTDRRLGADEFLLIDYGGSMHYYPADITRTFCLGAPSAEMQTIYDTVKAANAAGIAAAGPGVPMGAVDQAARAVIEAAGYGQYFIHRTGHGLGLEDRLIPQIAPGVTDLLEPGMAFTVEPGIYVPGLGGVRIEDNVVVTETGVDVLTSFPKQLLR
jgi:Xaa-Pro dipeptidase